MITPSFGLTATERVLPKLALDFTTASLDSRVTFTRTTGASNPATYVNSSGVVTAATNNQPRFDYDPITLACKGLLIEEARANFITYSEDFTNGATTGWGAINLTPSADTTVSPDGTQNADSLFETATNAQHRLDKVLVNAPGDYTFSCFIKSAGSRFASIRISGVGAYIDLTNGAVVNVGATTFGAVNYGNGWYRLYVGVAGVLANTTIRINNNGASGGFAATYVGDPTKAIVVWGAQFEAGAFPTSYIPTTIAPLTRNADVATMTGTDFSDWFNASEGTLQIKAIRKSSPAAGKFPYTGYLISTSGNDINLYQNGATSEQTLIRVSNVAQATFNMTVIPANTVFNHVVAYGNNSFASANSQSSVQTDNSGTVPSLSSMYIGSANSTGFELNGWVQQVNYWPMRVINNQVYAISRY